MPVLKANPARRNLQSGTSLTRRPASKLAEPTMRRCFFFFFFFPIAIVMLVLSFFNPWIVTMIQLMPYLEEMSFKNT